MNDFETHTGPAAPAPSPTRRRFQGRAGTAILGAGALGLLLLGAVGGATAWSMTRADAPGFDPSLAPTAIAALDDGMSNVGIEGQVAEIFGNKFILTDGAARALVETGRKGEDADLVRTGEMVMVQGRFEHGFLHAAAIRHADDDSVVLLAPPPRPDHGPAARKAPPPARADAPAPEPASAPAD